MKSLKKYKREGKHVYLDCIREMFVLATPEEEIRQKILINLIDKWKISKNLIRVEDNISHYKKGIRYRADIVVLHPNTLLSGKSINFSFVNHNMPRINY